MAQLRDPRGGCPWDLEQDFESLTSYTIEEAYEVADTINRGDLQHLKEELGDLLFQVVFYSQMAKEKELFNFPDVVAGLNEKMIERHPHVFNKSNESLSAAALNEIWEQKKLIKNNNKSVLDDIPDNFPGLMRAVKLTKRAAVIGFDWPSIDPVFEKMEEEIAELKEAMLSGQMDRIKDELGDVLFVCTNLARHLKIDPELAIRHANSKFEKRFRSIEILAKANQPNQMVYDLETLESLWNHVKKQE